MRQRDPSGSGRGSQNAKLYCGYGAFIIRILSRMVSSDDMAIEPINDIERKDYGIRFRLRGEFEMQISPFDSVWLLFSSAGLGLWSLTDEVITEKRLELNEYFDGCDGSLIEYK